MANYGVFPILRSNIRSAIHSYEGALKRLKNGENFILAPEGTRQETAQLGHFKSGPFILALKANSPVIPILILGPEKILSKKSLFLNIAQVNHIYVRILKPIPSSNFDIEQKEEYKKEVFEIMQKNFEEMKSKFYK